MKEKKVSVHQYINRREEIATRLNNIADTAEKENKREFTDAEKTEVDALRREMELINVRISGADKGGYIKLSSREAAFDAWIGEAVKSGKTTVSLQREFTGIDSTGAAATIPLTINDIVQPLENGLILDKVGIPLMTGLSGSYCWPVVGSVEASIAGETVPLADSDIDISKLEPTPTRLGVSIKVSNQAINQSNGVVMDIVKQQIPLAVQRTLNRVMFSHENFTSNLHGPFANAKTIGTFADTIPTYAELLKMKGDILASGVENADTFCYVMSEAMKATLEATPIDAGSGRMIVENGRIGGYPVFCTNFINYNKEKAQAAVEYIGCGVWSYNPIGQFGDTRLIVDPYSLSSEDIVKITLNADWSMTTLRKEAFALYKCAAPKA